jgi:hypothetical protein
MVRRVDTFQKIFPVRDKSLAIVHHGENVFLQGQRAVSLKDFVIWVVRENAEVFEQPSIEKMIERFAAVVGPIAKHTLRYRGEKLIGFWLAGFVSTSAKPKIWERCWFKDGREEGQDGQNLFVGGDGREYLLPRDRDFLDSTYNVQGIPRMSVKSVGAYHDKLYEKAVQKAPKPRCFSRRNDQLVIERDGWRWVQNPEAAHANRPSP